MKKFLLIMLVAGFMLANVVPSYASQGDVSTKGKVRIKNSQQQSTLSTPIFTKKQDKTQDSAPKSQLVALLLAISLGGFGLHRFYLGYTTRGIVMLLLTLSLVGSIVTFILTIIDIINIASGKLKPKDGSEYNPKM